MAPRQADANALADAELCSVRELAAVDGSREPRRRPCAATLKAAVVAGSALVVLACCRSAGVAPWLRTAADREGVLVASRSVSGGCLPLPQQVPDRNTPHIATSFSDASDDAYHTLLKGTKIFDGTALWDLTNASGTTNTGRELWAFGSRDSSNLYVFAVGTEALCLQYADTLFAISKADYYVLCPSVYVFSDGEWVMKQVAAVKWATASRSYKNIALGGHSGGGPAALGAGNWLAKDGVVVKGFVLQHTGAVPDTNVPGCERFAHHDRRKQECAAYYPVDMLSKLGGPILLTTGTFCQQVGANKSNYYKDYQNDSAWVANPSDCMVDTSFEKVYPTFLTPTSPVLPPPKGGIAVQTCGEHEFSVMGPPGLVAEGTPIVLPFLAAVAKGTPTPADFASILALNGKATTCVEQLTEAGDRALKLVEHDEVKMRYMLPDTSTRTTCTKEWLSTSSTTKVVSTAHWSEVGLSAVSV